MNYVSRYPCTVLDFRYADFYMKYRTLLLGMLISSVGIVTAQIKELNELRMSPEFNERNVRDAVRVDPKHYHLELENQYVRVLRVKLGSDEQVPMHDSHSATIVAITEVHLRFTRPDKKIIDVHLEAGGSRWIYDDSFSITNLIPRRAEFLFIEHKQADQRPTLERGSWQ